MTSTAPKYSKPTVRPAVLPPNPVPGNTPILVPYPDSDKHCDIHKPANIIPVIISKMFDKEPVVIISYNKDTLNDIVERCKAQAQVTVYTGDNNTQIAELKEFLKKPAGILVTDRQAFGGMQARNIVVVSSGYGDYIYGYNDRNMMLRATTQLVLVQTYKKDYIDTDSFVVDRVAECCFDISDSESDMDDDDDGGDHDDYDTTDHDDVVDMDE